MALGSIGALALVVQLTMEPFKKKPIPPPPAPAPPPPPSTAASATAVRDAGAASDGGADTEKCRALEKKYRELRAPVEACFGDSDCAIEARDPIWPGLDGCIRVAGKNGPTSAASDRVAQEWAAARCGDPRDAAEHARCPANPKVRCAKGRCGEQPPAGVPDDWQRFTLPHVLRTFLPPDMTPGPVGYGRVEWVSQEITGNGATLRIVERAPGKLTAKTAAADGTLVSQKAVKIDGHPATLFIVDVAKPAQKPLVGPFHARAGLDDLDSGSGILFHLELDMMATTKDKVEPLATILAHTDILVADAVVRDR
jgi:hypothetical protein